MPSRSLETSRTQSKPDKQRSPIKRFGTVVLIAAVALGVADKAPAAIHNMRHPATSSPDHIEHSYIGRPGVSNGIEVAVIDHFAGSRGQLEIDEHSNGTVEASVLGANNTKKVTWNMKCHNSGIQWFKAEHPGTTVDGVAVTHEVDVPFYTDNTPFGHEVCGDNNMAGVVNQYESATKLPHIPSVPVHLPSELLKVLG